MNSTELLAIRLYNQLLSTHEMKAPHEIFSKLEIGEELAERGVLLTHHHAERPHHRILEEEHEEKRPTDHAYLLREDAQEDRCALPAGD